MLNLGKTKELLLTDWLIQGWLCGYWFDEGLSGGWITEVYKSMSLSDLRGLKAKIVDELQRVRACNKSRHPKSHQFWRAREAEARMKQPSREKHHLFCSIEQLHGLIGATIQERSNQAAMKGGSEVALDPICTPWYRQILRNFVHDHQSRPKGQDSVAQNQYSNDNQLEC